MKDNSVSNYSIIWKYTIKPNQKEQFEKEYGKQGIWKELFIRSSDYQGSYLQKDADNPNVYLLIDIWNNRNTYEAFIIAYGIEYEALSKQCESLYIHEEKVGCFYSM